MKLTLEILRFEGNIGIRESLGVWSMVLRGASRKIDRLRGHRGAWHKEILGTEELPRGSQDG